MTQREVVDALTRSPGWQRAAAGFQRDAARAYAAARLVYDQWREHGAPDEKREDVASIQEWAADLSRHERAFRDWATLHALARAAGASGDAHVTVCGVCEHRALACDGAGASRCGECGSGMRCPTCVILRHDREVYGG